MRYLQDFRIRLSHRPGLQRFNDVQNIDLTRTHCFQSSVIIGDDEVFNGIQVREFILRVAFVMCPIICIFDQCRRSAGNKVLQNKGSGTDGMVPIIQVPPFSDSIGIFQAQRKVDFMDGFHD